MDDDGTLCGVHPFDINNLRLVSQFNGKGPDSFFVFLDCVSKARGWSDAECALLLKGKAREASLNSIDFCHYAKIKFAVLKAYELV